MAEQSTNRILKQSRRIQVFTIGLFLLFAAISFSGGSSRLAGASEGKKSAAHPSELTPVAAPATAKTGYKASPRTVRSESLSASKPFEPQGGDGFEIPSSVIAGGGGSSSSVSPNFGLVGTAGQAAAGTTSTSSNGQFSVTGGFWQQQPLSTVAISGTISYCAAAVPPGAANTTVTLSGDAAMVTSTGAAPSSGAYSFVNLAPGSYVVTPSKTGAVSGITTVDATRILQFLASTLTLTACQQLAADTSQNSMITTTDVTHILNFLASNPPVASNHTAEWRFNPANHSYLSIITDQTNQNFDAMLLGEVSGNWTPAGPSIEGATSARRVEASFQSPAVPCGAPPIAVTLPTASAGVNLTNFTLPILIGNTTGESVTGYRFTFTFDPAVVGLQATPTDATGTLSSGMSIQTNSSTPGTLIIVAAQASPLVGSGTLIKVNFTRVGAQGTSTNLTWTQNFLDDGNNDCVHPSTPVNGAIAIGAAPSASNGVVVGRITSSDGLPVSGAVVRLNGTQNRRTITDSDGNYHFESVETNGFYTVTPSRANYIFSPSQRTFSQLAERTEAAFGANFTGDAANPLDTPEYFVRQQYKDILGREPDEGGLSYWSDRVIDCGSETRCVSTRRSEVAAAFFIEAEYQQTGSFIYGLYKGALGRRPVYTEFSSDRQQVVAGANLEAARQAFAESFVSRVEFTSRYQQNTTADSFVNALLANVRQSSGVDLDSQRAALISRYNSGSNLIQSRSLVLRDVIDTAGFRQAEYNSAFVLTEYFAYLVRDPDQGGYAFWLDVLNNQEQNNYRSMVCAFVTSREYQERFSRVVTHSNAECGQ